MFQKEIAERFPYKTELHAHTSPCSSCANFSPADTVGFYQKDKVHSLVITNHLYGSWFEGDHDARAEEWLADYYAAKEAAKGSDMQVILGVEMRFYENINDYLVYGISPDDIPFFISLIPDGIENFYRKAKTDKNIILQAHPFRSGMKLAPLSAIDGIEAYNFHPGHNSVVGFAARYAQEHDLTVSGGTDFHHAGHDAMCLMRTEACMRDSYDVAEVLKERRAIFELSGSLVLPYSYI